jgi:hypothetical protein
VDRRDLGDLENGAVFRINPIGLNIYCGYAVKEAIEGSGLKGLTFQKIDPDDPSGMV